MSGVQGVDGQWLAKRLRLEHHGRLKRLFTVPSMAAWVGETIVPVIRSCRRSRGETKGAFSSAVAVGVESNG